MNMHILISQALLLDSRRPLLAVKSILGVGALQALLASWFWLDLGFKCVVCLSTEVHDNTCRIKYKPYNFVGILSVQDPHIIWTIIRQEPCWHHTLRLFDSVEAFQSKPKTNPFLNKLFKFKSAAYFPDYFQHCACHLILTGCWFWSQWNLLNHCIPITFSSCPTRTRVLPMFSFMSSCSTRSCSLQVFPDGPEPRGLISTVETWKKDRLSSQKAQKLKYTIHPPRQRTPWWRFCELGLSGNTRIHSSHVKIQSWIVFTKM